METDDCVAAHPLTERILKTYFTTLPLDDRENIFDFIRNFVIDQQTANQIFVPLDEIAEPGEDLSSSDESGDEADDEISDVSEVESEMVDVSPYTSHIIDSIEVFFQVRSLYEQYLLGQPFVSFETFYEDIFLSNHTLLSPRSQLSL